MNLIRLAVIGLLVCTAMTSAVSGQEVSDETPVSKVTIRMKNRPLYTVLWTLIQKYDVPIGFEESELDRNRNAYWFYAQRPVNESTIREYADREMFPAALPAKKYLISVDFTDADIETVLRSVVAQMRNYRLEKNEGVYNIVPFRGRDERLRRLMDLKVKEFLVGIEATADSILPRILLFLPEFKVFIDENSLQAQLGSDMGYFDERIFPDGVRLIDLTFRQLLNRLTVLKRGGWIVRIHGKDGKSGADLIEISI